MTTPAPPGSDKDYQCQDHCFKDSAGTFVLAVCQDSGVNHKDGKVDGSGSRV